MADLLVGSFLERLILAVRRYTDEPSVNVKYTDNDLLAKISEAWSELWIELNNNNDSPIIVRHDITIVADQQNYALPPNVGRIMRIASINTTTDLVDWELDSFSFFNPGGFGFRIEGNYLRLSRKWDDGATVRLEYVPCAEVRPITGTWAIGNDITVTSTSAEINVATNLGVLDTRENAYAGYILRSIPPNGTTPVAGDGKTIVQERLITAYNSITRIATVAAAFNPALDGVSATSPSWASTVVTYEIIPMHMVMLESVLALRTCMNIVAIEGNVDRLKLMNREYASKIRSTRLSLMNQMGRRAHQFEGDISENRRYSRFGRQFLGA